MKDLSRRMSQLADQIGKLPNTGMVSTKRVNPIIKDLVALIIETIDTANERIQTANQIASEADSFAELAMGAVLAEHQITAGRC